MSEWKISKIDLEQKIVTLEPSDGNAQEGVKPTVKSGQVLVVDHLGVGGLVRVVDDLRFLQLGASIIPPLDVTNE